MATINSNTQVPFGNRQELKFKCAISMLQTFVTSLILIFKKFYLCWYSHIPCVFVASLSAILTVSGLSLM